MIPAHKLADTRFILFPSHTPCQQVQEALTQLDSLAAIVRHHPTDAELTYHLYPAAALLEHLSTSNIPPDSPLQNCLTLTTPTPTLDAYDDAQAVPWQCVMTYNNGVVGFYDVTLPTAHKGARWQDHLANGNPLPLSLQAQFPDAIPVGQTASLLIHLTQIMNQRHSLPMAVPVGSQVDVVVQTVAGFDLAAWGEGTLTVIEEKETLPIQFKLTAVSIGSGRIRILAFHHGRPLGELILTPTITEAAAAVAPMPKTEKRLLPPLVYSPPDLSILVFEHPQQNSFTIRLTALDPNLGLNLKRYGPIPLHKPAAYFQAFFKHIEGLNITSKQGRDEVVARLAQAGTHLFQEILPLDLQTLLWSLRSRIHTVQIMSEEPWIPWELLKMCHTEQNGRIVAGPFFCEAFAVTRWYPGIERRPFLTLQNIAIINPTDSGLDFAPSEWEYLFTLENDQRQVTEIPATFLDIITALKAGQHDCWHFTGHGAIDAADPFLSTLFLQKGQRLYPENISGDVQNCGRKRPFVFLNACQTGQQGFSLTGIGGWAHRFVHTGAAAFVGTLWSVQDKSAFILAQSLYEALLTGQPMGAAMKKAREASYKGDSLSWLAYTVFADPACRVGE